MPGSEPVTKGRARGGRRSRRRPAARAVAAVPIATTGVATATTRTVTVYPDGTFAPNTIAINPGDTVRWVGPAGAFGSIKPLGRADSIARIAAPVASATPGADVCQTAAAAHPRRRAFDPAQLDEFTGPTRTGLSGIWVLGPEGGKVSAIEIPSAEAAALGVDGSPTIAPLAKCGQLDREAVADGFRWRYTYTTAVHATSPDGSSPPILGFEHTGAGWHWLCDAAVERCQLDGTGCEPWTPNSRERASQPPGTYLNGLLSSTYANPDVTGVVLRFNWSDLQVDDAGTVRGNWTDLDRELARAVAHGKLVTLDVRAGRYGTPAWIFDDYLAPGAGPAWCPGGGCPFVAAPADAGQVVPRWFRDHYDEDLANGTCGALMKLGSPMDDEYRALYTGFLGDLAENVASDTRWWNAIAHVKVSGANLQTSEAELPHHCDDLYRATGAHVPAPNGPSLAGGDGVLDSYKTDGATDRTEACVCNPEQWLAAAYTPEDLFEYYAQVEEAIADSFFGRKGLGYQLIQAGFPRTDAATGRYWGDHLYREVASPAVTDPAWINAGAASGATCAVADAAVVEHPVLNRVSYCSADLVDLALAVATPDPGNSNLAIAEDTAGTAYPPATAQAVQILANARAGKFRRDVAAAPTSRQRGALFAPQHSGLQPLGHEQDDLGYADTGPLPPAPCTLQDGTAQQRARRAAPAGAMGPWVADFPIPETTGTNGADHGGPGCPNPWIVDQGRAQAVQSTVSVPILEWHELPTLGPIPCGPFDPAAPIDGWCSPMPLGGYWTLEYTPVDVTLRYPPNVIGYQTTNKVHRQDHVESALFNLAYDTNAVWIELYEDAVWRIAITRGTGLTAAPISTRTAPVGGGDTACSYVDLGGRHDELCYAKNLAQWAEELHWRRATIEATWATFQGLRYPALDDPFPATYEYTFTNPTGAPLAFAYINPTTCDPARVLAPSAGAAVPSAMGTIVVGP